MDIEILGAHNIESQDTRHVSLLIDDVLAVEAGALTSSLTFPAQQKLKAILLSHQHYDHIRDMPAIGMNFSLHENTVEVYGIQPVYEALSAHLLNDSLYPNFMARPPEKPSLQFKKLEPGRVESIHGYTVLPVPVNHSVPTVGLQVTSADGKTIFYTADTGPGLNQVWKQVTPELLIIEVTTCNKYEKFAHQAGHLTSALLQQELESFRDIKGYLPQVVLVHMNPLEEEAIKAEIAVVARSLKTTIRFGYEGMRIQL
jgi:ribonuclease BN (tRNA processing enzyme)